MSESSWWLLVRGRGGEAVDVLNKLVRLNGKKLPPNLRLVNPVRVREVEAVEKKSLWRIQWVAKRMVTVMVDGFGVGFVYSKV